MSGFKLISSDVRTLNHELAIRFRDMTASPTERTLDPKRVNHLREKVEAGRAIPFNWATAKLGDKTYRMNGQHSSAMLAAMNGSMPDGLKVHWDEYAVDDREGLAVLFRQFDDRKSSRTTGDVSGAYQGLYDDLSGIDRGLAKLTVEGVVWWREKVEGIPVPKGDSIYELFGNVQVQEFVKWTHGILTIKTPELKRAPIVAAMYATRHVNSTEAETFWTEVARGGIETDDTHPTTVLDGWLRKTKEEPELAAKLKPGNYYQGCLFAWNALREGKSIKDIKHDTRKGFHAIVE